MKYKRLFFVEKSIFLLTQVFNICMLMITHYEYTGNEHV